MAAADTLTCHLWNLCASVRLILSYNQRLSHRCQGLLWHADRSQLELINQPARPRLRRDRQKRREIGRAVDVEPDAWQLDNARLQFSLARRSEMRRETVVAKTQRH